MPLCKPKNSTALLCSQCINFLSLQTQHNHNDRPTFVDILKRVSSVYDTITGPVKWEKVELSAEKIKQVSKFRAQRVTWLQKAGYALWQTAKRAEQKDEWENGQRDQGAKGECAPDTLAPPPQDEPQKERTPAPPVNDIGQPPSSPAKVLVSAQRAWQISLENMKLGDTVLGRGAFGEVRKAEYMGTAVAVKRLLGSQCEVKFIKYLEREIASLTSMRHPNVVQFLGMTFSDTVGTEQRGEIYLVAEFMEGGDVAAKLRNPAYEINWKQRASILRDVACAMVYIHGKGERSIPLCLRAPALNFS